MKRILNRIVFLLGVMLVWEIVYRLDVFPDLLFPSVGSIFSALIKGFMEKDLLTKTINSLILIFEGVTLGIIISLVLLCLSIMNKFFFNIINNMLVFLNPIPSIAIFPLCILWFGIGKNALLVVMLHSVVWGLLLNALTGVEAIPKIYREIE